MTTAQLLLGALVVISCGFGRHNWKAAKNEQYASGRRRTICAKAKWRRGIAVAFYILALGIFIAAWLQYTH